MNSRQEIVEEMVLREQIRKVIRIVKERRRKADAQMLNEEKELRSVLRKIILSEAGAMDPVDTAPRSNSTVKNHLEDLFQNTIKQVLDDYESLGEKEEREGFFAGFLAGLRNKFDEFDGITDTADVAGPLDEAIDIDIEDEGPIAPDVFIPGGEDSDLAPEEEPEDEGPVVAPEEQTPEYKLGYNIAQETLPKVETQVMKGYEQFSKVGDQQRANVYKDWAIINYGLHMINKEKLITGEFPEMPADFAAELEKFRAAGGTEGAALEGEADLPPLPPEEAPLPPEGAPLPPEEPTGPPLEESFELVG